MCYDFALPVKTRTTSAKHVLRNRLLCETEPSTIHFFSFYVFVNQ